ncbi:protein kinase domain-containing protein [Bacillus sp. 03113]|uniref:serine/threonine protein kinase n=1 Tax=Bacillus sp. 03113 TaxID=2578211 RepID=UPI0011433467|nr:protein kinase [Bacillus sp. 03113]
MINHTLKNRCRVNAGTVIEGKWHKQKYTIIKELGYGANGTVYLAQYLNKQVALKMSHNGISITSEVNVLKSFEKVHGYALGPSLIDVDDWITRSGIISFYVMEYIKGMDLLSFIKQKGHSWTGVLIIQLLKDLDILHQNGWVFGDLKPDNLIITSQPTRIRCIDVGGTTMKGRTIKEFTEFFDRGYWGLGMRRADPGYDLFAVAMILINLAYPNRFEKKEGGIIQLTKMIRQINELQQYEKVLLSALQGRYGTAKEMRSELLELMGQDSANRQSRNQSSKQSPKQNHPSLSRQNRRKMKKKGGVIETLFICFIVFMFYVLYLLLQ